MKWNEMKWNEMKWNEMKWNGMGWNEMNGNAMHIVLKYFSLIWDQLFSYFFFFLKEDYYRVSVDEKVSTVVKNRVKLKNMYSYFKFQKDYNCDL